MAPSVPVDWRCSLPVGVEVPIPTLLLKVSIPKTDPLTVKALLFKVKVNAAVPEEDVKEMAPVDKVRPFEPVSKPDEVIVPVEEVEILPEVVTESPVNEGDRVVEALLHKPDCPDDDPTPIPPEQVNSPVESCKEHPVEPDPPAKSILPPAPGLMFRVVDATDAPIETDDDPVKRRVVELKVLVLMVEENVAALATVNPPVLLNDNAPVPEVVKLKPAVAISVDASSVRASLNLSKSNESSVTKDPDKELVHDASPDELEVKK